MKPPDLRESSDVRRNIEVLAATPMPEMAAIQAHMRALQRRDGS